MPGPSVRPLAASDADAVHEISVEAFRDLNRRFGEPPEPAGPVAAARVRVGRLLATDPGGAWVAEHGGELVGCSLALVRDGAIRLLAAFDDEGATQLLRACLAATGPHEASVEWITSAHGWAVAPCLEAGLELRSDLGGVFVAGDVGPFAPYLPSGAYL